MQRTQLKIPLSFQVREMCLLFYVLFVSLFKNNCFCCSFRAFFMQSFSVLWLRRGTIKYGAMGSIYMERSAAHGNVANTIALSEYVGYCHKEKSADILNTAYVYGNATAEQRRQNTTVLPQ